MFICAQIKGLDLEYQGEAFEYIFRRPLVVLGSLVLKKFWYRQIQETYYLSE
jgi:hypothetical protein